MKYNTSHLIEEVAIAEFRPGDGATTSEFRPGGG
jgi:hypothetical protein